MSLQHAISLYQSRRFAEAEAALRSLATECDRIPDYHRLAGLVAVDLQKGDRALTHFTRAVELAPNEPTHLFNLAEINRALGRLPQAADAYRRLIALEPRATGAHMALAETMIALKDPAAAAESFRRALETEPQNLALHQHVAKSLEKLECVSDAIFCRQRIRALAPADFENEVKLRGLYTRAVALWHFPMMNDEVRNDAYDRAIRRAVRPDMHVLDIGTGAGLLSMMAARAGARGVTTCEVVPEIAAMAKQIVAANGFSDRITVVPKLSTDMVVGIDMPERADLLISEVLSSELLAENVVETVAHARAHLIKPGAAMIPRAVSAMATLVGGDDLAKAVSVDRAAGFDVSLFNEFSPGVINILMDSSRFDTLADDVEIFRFNLGSDIAPEGIAAHAVPIRRSGLCVGVLQWIRLYLDEETIFENRPTPERQVSGWRHVLFTLPRPVPVREGQVARIEARHARSSIAFIVRDIA